MNFLHMWNQETILDDSAKFKFKAIQPHNSIEIDHIVPKYCYISAASPTNKENFDSLTR